jgi:hypothetical protein
MDMLSALKKMLRTMLPGAYGLAARAKNSLFPPERWGNYYDGSDPDLRMPERCLIELAPRLQKNVTRILNLGCGAGRDFIPFNGKMQLWGIDLVPYERIKWVTPFKELTYEKIAVEELTRRLESRSIDLSDTLVYSSGTLMYVSREEQARFFEACRRNGCRNFIFQEYPPDSSIYPETNFKLPLSLFESRLFRPASDGLTTYFSLA